MPRLPSRLLVPALTLIALLFLTPTHATALPLGTILSSAAESPEATPGLFSRLWGFLSAVWANGPGLEPNGATAGAASGSEPNAATGDNGSILEPNG